MAYISDVDRSVFREAAQTVLDNLNDQELWAISDLANQLNSILEVAKKRAAKKFQE